MSGLDLSGLDLSIFNLNEGNLSGANLSNTIVDNVTLRGANLSEANLNGVDLSGVDLSTTNLSGVKLHNVNLRGIKLHNVTLKGVDLSGTDLTGVDLSGADLSGADLSKTNLCKVQVLGTNFSEATLTGACIEDWNTNSTTKFDRVICEYIYRKADQKERRPRKGYFKPGEFSALFQQAIDTVDLIFKDGIDWRAFFQSFQDLCSQYADQDLAIQAIERKQGEAFVVRLEVSEDADKPAIESSAQELYETKLLLMEQRYRANLQAKEGEIVAYREQSANLMEIVKLQASRTINVEANAMADNSNRTTDLRGAQFGGGYAEVVQGDQIGGTINNYGSSAADITRLITALREHTQAFPDEQKDNALDILDDLEGDLAKPAPDPGRIGRRLKRLVAIATTLTIGATAFTADLAQLADVLNVPLPQIEQVQPDQLPPSD